MKSKRMPYPVSQRGAVLVIATLGMVVLLGMVGLALDLGHAYLNKTRLQNMVDAAALSAAKQLDVTQDPTAATNAALSTFSANASGQGNGEVAQGLSSGDLSVTTQFSDTLDPFVPGASPGQYVRVRADTLVLPAWFVRVFGRTHFDVTASAVAGPSPTLQRVCNVAPMMVCSGSDTDPSAVFGYAADQVTVLKMSASGGTPGPGNFQLINLDGSTGGSDIRANMAGEYNACLDQNQNVVTTKPGNTVGPVVQGLNTRLAVYEGPYSSYTAYTSPYPPDVITTQNTVALTSPPQPASQLSYNYQDYLADLESNNLTYPNVGRPGRRMLTVPVGNCSAVGTDANGNTTVPLVGFGCFFLLQQAVQKGNGSEADVYGEFEGQCQANGVSGPSPNSGPGPYIIQLYKDPNSNDS